MRSHLGSSFSVKGLIRTLEPVDLLLQLLHGSLGELSAGLSLRIGMVNREEEYVRIFLESREGVRNIQRNTEETQNVNQNMHKESHNHARKLGILMMDKTKAVT